MTSRESTPVPSDVVERATAAFWSRAAGFSQNPPPPPSPDDEEWSQLRECIAAALQVTSPPPRDTLAEFLRKLDGYMAGALDCRVSAAGWRGIVEKWREEIAAALKEAQP